MAATDKFVERDLRSVPPKVNILGFGGLLLVVLASVPVFFAGYRELVQAWSTPEYSHGPLIPLISLYLFLRELRHAPAAPGETVLRWPGVAVIGFAMLIAIFGNLVLVGDIVAYSFIIWTFGLVLLTFGWRRGLGHWKYPRRA